MMTNFQANFAFPQQEPRALFQTNDRNVVAATIARRDNMVSNGEQPHRVTEYFVGTQEGSLRTHMETYAQGGEASSVLMQELMPYQLTKIDDTLCRNGT